MQLRRVPVLRIIAAVMALAAFTFCILHLASLVSVWRGDPGTVATIAPWVIPSRILRLLAWGVGFAVLAFVITWRVGHKREVLVAAFFLALYALGAGIARNPMFRGQPWMFQKMIVMDGLIHSIGIRFTQLFPRPLTQAEVARFGRGWFRRFFSPVLATLTRPRFYWPFAILLEAVGRTGGMPGFYYAHVVTWLMLGTAYLWIAYRQGSNEDRQRIFWILEGVLVFLSIELLWLAMWSMDALGILSFNLGFWGSWQSVVEAWVTLICFALAIFYSGAFDSGLILRRTTVLSVSGALAVILFIALETTIGEVMTDMLGFNTRTGDIVIGVLAALAFRPMSERIDRRVVGWTSGAS